MAWLPVGSYTTIRESVLCIHRVQKSINVWFWPWVLVCPPSLAVTRQHWTVPEQTPHWWRWPQTLLSCWLFQVRSCRPWLASLFRASWGDQGWNSPRPSSVRPALLEDSLHAKEMHKIVDAIGEWIRCRDYQGLIPGRWRCRFSHAVTSCVYIAQSAIALWVQICLIYSSSSVLIILKRLLPKLD